MKGASGVFGVLPGHVPTIAQLQPGVVTVEYDSDAGTATDDYFVCGGFAYIKSNSDCDVCAVEACKVDDIDLAEVNSLLAEASSAMSSGEDEGAKAEAEIRVEVLTAMAAAAGQAGRVFQYKLVLLGDSAVGKSSLVLRFVRGQFFEYQESTIGAAFLTQTVALNETTVKFEIWDTAGQERYHSLAPMYYRGAAAAIVVYDITNRDSFQRAKQWVKELQRQGNPNIVIALAGNKSDLNSKRKVEPEEAESYASDNGIFFMETSAKTATNVNELFVAIARKLPKNTPQPRPGGQGLVISQNQGETTKKSSCC